MPRLAIALSPVALSALVLVSCSPPDSQRPSPEATREMPAASVEPILAGDADRGQTVFARCRSCHTVAEGRNGVGPSLFGVVGRQAGAVSDFRYSPANRQSDVIWSAETLDAYLENPRQYMPGTYMSFAGLRQPQDRADVIAYLETQPERSSAPITNP